MGSDNKPKDELPVLTDSGSPVRLMILFVVPGIIALGIAFATYKMGSSATYDTMIAALGTNAWGYAGLWMLCRTISFINFFPASCYKEAIKGNMRSNPFIFSTIGGDDDEKIVVMKSDGVVGKYNRANRSIHHMVENFGGFVAGFYAVSQIFPFPAFVASLLFCTGRIAHQIGYTSGYGSHAPGFLLSWIGTMIIEGLLGLTALKGLGYL